MQINIFKISALVLFLFVCETVLAAPLYIKNESGESLELGTDGTLTSEFHLSEEHDTELMKLGFTIKNSEMKNLNISEDKLKIRREIEEGASFPTSSNIKFRDNSSGVTKTNVEVVDNGNLKIGKTFKDGPVYGSGRNWMKVTLYSDTGSSSRNRQVITYFDGLGRNVQSQVSKPDGEYLVRGSYYNDKGENVKTTKTFSHKTNGRYLEMHKGTTLLDHVNNYYGDKAYREFKYRDDHSGRLAAMGAEGEKYSLNGQHYEVWHKGIYIADEGTYTSKFLTKSQIEAGIHTTLTNEASATHYLKVKKLANGTYRQEISNIWNNVVAKAEFSGNELLVTVYRYDFKNRLTEAISPLGEEFKTTYKYNKVGQLEEEYNPDSKTSTFEYYETGEIKFSHDEDGYTEKYIYNDLGDLETILGYDPHGKQISKVKSYFDNVTTLLDDHGDIPQIQSIANSLTYLKGVNFGSVTTAKDGKRIVRLISNDRYGQVKESFTYIESVGWQKVLTKKNFSGLPLYSENTCLLGTNEEKTVRTNFTYDENMVLVSVDDEEGNPIVDYKYDELGSMTEYGIHTSKGRKKVAYSFNIRDWLTGIDAGDYFKESIDLTNSYDGLPTAIDFTYSENKQYHLAYNYDESNRLTKVNSNHDGYNEAFKYDKGGRLTGKVRGVGAVASLDDYKYYENTHRLKNVTSKHGDITNYVYNNNGTMKSDKSKHLEIEYDHRDLPQKFSFNKDGNWVSDVHMLYDAGMNRVLKHEVTTTGEKKIAYFDGGAVATQKNSEAFSFDYVNIPSPGGVIGRIDLKKGKNYYYISDHLGSTRSVISESGDVVEEIMYDAYGKSETIMMSSEIDKDDEVREKFTGKEFDTEGADESMGISGIGAYYFGARYYDPEIGIWLTPDPAREFFNSYSYLNGAVVNTIDIFGLQGATPGYDPSVGGLTGKHFQKKGTVILTPANSSKGLNTTTHQDESIQEKNQIKGQVTESTPAATGEVEDKTGGNVTGDDGGSGSGFIDMVSNKPTRMGDMRGEEETSVTSAKYSGGAEQTSHGMGSQRSGSGQSRSFFSLFKSYSKGQSDAISDEVVKQVTNSPYAFMFSRKNRNRMLTSVKDQVVHGFKMQVTFGMYGAYETYNMLPVHYDWAMYQIKTMTPEKVFYGIGYLRNYFGIMILKAYIMRKVLGPPPGCFVAGTVVLLSDGTFMEIEKIKVGDVVQSTTATQYVPLDPATTKVITLTMVNPRDVSDTLTIQMLRSDDWVLDNLIIEGTNTAVEIPELGIKGYAFVEDITDMDDTFQGAEYSHSTVQSTNQLIYTIKLDGLTEPVISLHNQKVHSVTDSTELMVKELETGDVIKLPNGEFTVNDIHFEEKVNN